MSQPATVASLEAYLALESEAETKHEYLNGVVVAMAGASPRHNLIANNVGSLLSAALDSSPCRVFNSDQRVRIEQTRSYVYPDVVVVCDEPRLTDERPASLQNPTLLVEILSPSTQDDDYAKLSHYRKLPSVGEVLLIDPNERHVERVRRLDSGEWLITDVFGGRFDLPSVGASLDIEEIYAKVDGLPPDRPADRG